MHVAVVGAGAFGGWTALSLLRRGARVTVLDAWGPGNSRSTSGGETRVIRAGYGTRHTYIPMVARALGLWRENQARWETRVLEQTGVLWIFPGDDSYLAESISLIRENGFEVDELESADAARRYPHMTFDDIRRVYFEPAAGYLRARLACRTVLEDAIAEGAEYRPLAVEPGGIANGAMGGLRLSDGSTLESDAYIFACGPWLPKLFPDLLGDKITPTRQDVFFFGAPAGDARFYEDNMPVWVEIGDAMMYGIPGSRHRGFKAADDTRGGPIDPSDLDRLPLAENLESVRRYLSRRFPARRRAIRSVIRPLPVLSALPYSSGPSLPHASTAVTR